MSSTRLPTADALLAHADWIRALARSLEVARLPVTLVPGETKIVRF